MGLLYNVAAFMRPDHPLEVTHQIDPSSSWPINIKIGTGGDSINLFSDVQSAAKLRDALTHAIDQAQAAR